VKTNGKKGFAVFMIPRFGFLFLAGIILIVNFENLTDKILAITIASVIFSSIISAIMEGLSHLQKEQ